MSANPIANGGLVRKPLDMPDFRDSAVEVKKPGATLAGNVPTLGNFLREVMRVDMDRFRVFGPDETQSNRLEAIYEVAKKVWMAEYFPEDSDGGELAPNGRVMEILSEHTVEGWLEGYILSGRHGLLNSYEPFIHVIDSMFNQHAKWLEKCNELPWRANVSSLNLLITALKTASNSRSVIPCACSVVTRRRGTSIRHWNWLSKIRQTGSAWQLMPSTGCPVFRSPEPAFARRCSTSR
jgi:xylulose-5-phosphate/fructose-6-phosphate phosphoketolase